jgi:hypothetical protein
MYTLELPPISAAYDRSDRLYWVVGCFKPLDGLHNFNLVNFITGESPLTKKTASSLYCF